MKTAISLPKYNDMTNQNKIYRSYCEQFYVGTIYFYSTTPFRHIRKSPCTTDKRYMVVTAYKCLMATAPYS